MDSVQACFAKVDTNGQGVLDCAKLAAALKKVDADVFNDKFIAQFLEHGEGVVDYRAFSEWLFGDSVNRNFTHTEGAADEDIETLDMNLSSMDSMLTKAMDKFKSLDANGNGILEAKELPDLCRWVFSEFGRRFKSPKEEKTAIEKQVKRFLKMSEGQNWDFPRFSEYYEKVIEDALTYQLKRAEAFKTGYDQSEAAKKFRELDADGSGYLEGEELEEFASWIFKGFHPDGQELSPEQRKIEAQKLIHRIDENRGNSDGKLSYTEVDFYINQKINEITNFQKRQAEREAKKSAKKDK
eukprot:TRINITY_DN15382_c0_g1_i1.p1 TRINITY_DN15382_c0_g1~~TRINITY_DN15382_c0_g1_i1.p1  ORF type:complete len:334 (-),score=87.22 TRINITY_DN15382_c0_g1_i1:88-978(-)